MSSWTTRARNGSVSDPNAGDVPDSQDSEGGPLIVATATMTHTQVTGHVVAESTEKTASAECSEVDSSTAKRSRSEDDDDADQPASKSARV